MSIYTRSETDSVYIRQANHSKGQIIGLSCDCVHRYCGAPDSASPVGNGIKHCIWQRGSCTISLLFDEQDICVGIDHISL